MLLTRLLGTAGRGPIRGWRRGRGRGASLRFCAGLARGWMLGRKTANGLVERERLGTRGSEDEGDGRASIRIHHQQVFTALTQRSPRRRALVAEIDRRDRVATHDLVVAV